MAKDFVFQLEKFRGLHVSRDQSRELGAGESPDMLNFKVTKGYKLKKRDGYFKIHAGDRIRGIWNGNIRGQEWFVCVDCDELAASRNGFDELEYVGNGIAGTGEVQFFPFYQALYILTGEGIWKFDGEALAPLEAHIPTIMISTPPSGAGVPFEEVNLLTRTVRQTFSPTGQDGFFRGVFPVIDHIVSVTLDGEVLEDDQYYFDGITGRFCILNIPPAGTDTLEIVYVLYGEDPSHRIHNCRYALAFGGANDTRAFLYGNEDSPAMRYHSGVVNGEPCMEYFPETGYTLVGNGSPITSVVRHYDRQLIFTKEAAYYSYLDYMTGSDDRLVASFPVFPLSDDCGNLAFGQGILLENDPCTVMGSGLYRWISTNVRDERNTKLFSQPINARLTEEKLENARLFNRKSTSELFVWVGENLYVYNYLLKLFYFYRVPKILSFCEMGEALYFATERDIFSVSGTTDDGESIPAHWSSMGFEFDEMGKMKNLHRISLFANGEDEQTVLLTLRNERGETWEKDLSFEGKEEIRVRSLRARPRRFRVLEMKLTADGQTPFHLFGVELKGRITDQKIKE